MWGEEPRATGMFSRFDYIDAALTTADRFTDLVLGVGDPDTRLPDTPARFHGIEDLPRHVVNVPNDTQAVKDIIVTTLTPHTQE